MDVTNGCKIVNDSSSSSSLSASERRSNALGRRRKFNPVAILKQHRLESVRHIGMHDTAIPVLVDEHFQTLVRGAPDDFQDLPACRVAPMRESCELDLRKLSLDTTSHINKAVTQACSGVQVCGRISKIDMLKKASVSQDLQKLRLAKSAGKVPQEQCCAAFCRVQPQGGKDSWRSSEGAWRTNGRSIRGPVEVRVLT